MAYSHSQQISHLSEEVLMTVTGRPFEVHSVKQGEYVCVVPLATKIPRIIKWSELDKAYAELENEGEITVSRIRKVGASDDNPAYVFAILAATIEESSLDGRVLRLN